MMRQLVLGLLLLTVCGCSGAVGEGQAAPATRTPGPVIIAPSATGTSTASDAATVSNLPTIADATATIGLPTATSAAATPASPALNRPTGAILPTPMLTTGWKTYANMSWQVALDYPVDWTIHESAAMVTWVSPGGALIQLTPVATGTAPSEAGNDLPNTRCTSQTNPHGITAHVCFDTLASSIIADFGVNPPGGGERWFTLVTNRRTGDLGVFAAMLASVRPAA